MKNKVLVGIQIVAGLMLIMFGSNKFIHFMSMPESSVAMGLFMGALNAADYVFPVVGAVEVLAGVAFVVNRYVALMVVILTPVMLNAFLAHLVLDTSGIGGSAMLLVMMGTIFYNHRAEYKPLFKF